MNADMLALTLCAKRADAATGVCKSQTYGGGGIDDLVGAEVERWWEREPQRLRGLDVDREFERGRLQHRELGRFGALEIRPHRSQPGDRRR